MSEEIYKSISTKEDAQDPHIPTTDHLNYLDEKERRPLLSSKTSEESRIRPYEDRPFRTESTWGIGVRSMMVIWTCLGLAVAISHHLLCRYLDGRSVQDKLPFGNNLVTYQQVVNSAGNAMALVVQASFNAAIGLLFIQQFWFQIRRRPFSAKKINDVMAMKDNLLSFSGVRTILSRATVLLSIIAVIAFTLSVITVVAPGSLTVAQSPFTQKTTCQVPQIQLQFPDMLSNYIFDDPTGTNLANSSLPAIRNLAGVVLLLKSYLPPTTPCGQCKYSIVIEAPAIVCQNMSTSTNIGPMTADVPSNATIAARLMPTKNLRRDLTSSPDDGTASPSDGTASPNDGYSISTSAQSAVLPNIGVPTILTNSTPPDLVDNFVWNATYSLNETGLVLFASWRSGNFKNDTFNPVGAAVCIAYNATYYTDVVHGISASTMNVTSIDFHNTLALPSSANVTFNETISMFAMVDALALQIQGALSFDTSGNPARQTSMASYTLGTIRNNGYWDWVTDPQIAIPWMMQNLTLSMLARNLGNDPTQSTVANVGRECQSSTLTFQYNEFRLTGTYAAGALVTIICVVAGFWRVRQNTIDESFDLSRWMDGLVHQDMLDKLQSGELTEDTPLQLRESDGRLAVAHQHIKSSP